MQPRRAGVHFTERRCAVWEARWIGPQPFHVDRLGLSDWLGAHVQRMSRAIVGTGTQGRRREAAADSDTGGADSSSTRWAGAPAGHPALGPRRVEDGRGACAAGGRQRIRPRKSLGEARPFRGRVLTPKSGDQRVVAQPAGRSGPRIDRRLVPSRRLAGRGGRRSEAATPSLSRGESSTNGSEGVAAASSGGPRSEPEEAPRPRPSAQHKLSSPSAKGSQPSGVFGARGFEPPTLGPGHTSL